MFHFDRFSQIFKLFHLLNSESCGKISSYAFKMRQDYLSTRYLDQFISPSFRFAHLGDIFDPSN